MATPLILCENLVKIYKVADLEVVALQGLDLVVQPNEMVALMGASGSGKSTLLNVISALDAPSAGRCKVAGYDITQLTDAQRLEYRRGVIGHVWQQGGRNLIPRLSLAENLTVPQVAGDVPARERRRRIHELMDMVGLRGMERRYPHELSGGEQQRAGIAVAIAHRPAVLLADEPTGELDSSTAQHILDLFRQIQDMYHLTLLLVTHDARVAARADRVVAMRDGRASTETRRRLQIGVAEEEGVSPLTGLALATHDELIVVDPSGRLQLPREMMDEVGIADRVKILAAGDHLELWPLSGTDCRQEGA